MLQLTFFYSSFVTFQTDTVSYITLQWVIDNNLHNKYVDTTSFFFWGENFLFFYTLEWGHFGPF